MCRAEKVGVTGDAASEVDEVCVWEVVRSVSESEALSLFFRSSTSCGSNKGLSWGDIALGGSLRAGGRRAVVVDGRSRGQRSVDDIVTGFMGEVFLGRGSSAVPSSLSRRAGESTASVIR